MLSKPLGHINAGNNLSDILRVNNFISPLADGVGLLFSGIIIDQLLVIFTVLSFNSFQVVVSKRAIASSVALAGHTTSHPDLPIHTHHVSSLYM